MVLTNNIKAAHMTQQEAADCLHVERVTYARYEFDQRFPSVQMLMSISQLFHQSMDYLVGNGLPVQEITDEEQELFDLWRSSDKASHPYAISVLKTKQSICERKNHLNKKEVNYVKTPNDQGHEN